MTQSYRPPNLNQVLLSGRAVADPELRYTQSGTPVMQFRIAVSRRYQEKTTGDWKEDASFFNVVAWGPLAERLAERLTKGMAIMVEGELRSREWENKEGKRQITVEVNARNVQVLTVRDRQEPIPETTSSPPRPEPADESADEQGEKSDGSQLDDIPF